MASAVRQTCGGPVSAPMWTPSDVDPLDPEPAETGRRCAPARGAGCATEKGPQGIPAGLSFPSLLVPVGQQARQRAPIVPRPQRVLRLRQLPHPVLQRPVHVPLSVVVKL